MESAIKLVNITKRFGSVIANHNINLDIRKGEILSLLGENGSGKTTLMNIISGIYYPDEGQIIKNGEEIHITCPKDSYGFGIGMIHQHFKLIDVFTALENIMLGMGNKFTNDIKGAEQKINEIQNRYGFNIDIHKKIYDMSVSEKQTVEILKVLYRGAEILILDEPTAVLTPQETDKLFTVLRNMRDDGKAVIIITHKLQEVLSLSDYVSILRKGELIGTIKTSDANEEILTEMMVGEKVVLNIKRSEPKDTRVALHVENLTVYNKYGIKALDSATFDAYSGEVLGVAGIAGSGQKELLEAIAGLQHAEGSISFTSNQGKVSELVGMNAEQIRKIGVALSFIPEDRLGMGLVGNMGMTENMLVRSYRNGKTQILQMKEPMALANVIKEKLEVVTPSISTPVRKLSGGNVQKVLVGREIASQPQVLMTAYAVRGLDINTSYQIYNIMNDEKERGATVIYVGEDLDVLLSLCDRIMVLCGGKVSGVLDARNTTKQQIGRYMAEYMGGMNHDAEE